MDADFSVELGADDETLTVPWRSADGRLRYYDLKRQPEMLLYVSEASHYRELGEFLVRVNGPISRLESAKCDAWFTRELAEEEEIYGAGGKFVSYVDLFFSEEERRFSFQQHEELVRRLATLLGRAPQISAAAEFIVRRCSYETQNQTVQGFSITFYLSGYGDDESEARQRWGIGLQLVGNAILQVSAAPHAPQRGT